MGDGRTTDDAEATGDAVGSGAIDGPNLRPESYRVRRSVLENRYEVTDESGDVILRSALDDVFRTDEYTFRDADGETVLSVAPAPGDGGDYGIATGPDRDPFALLTHETGLRGDVWEVRDPRDGRGVARIESTRTAIEIVRRLVGRKADPLPRRWAITDSDGRTVGSITERLSLRDRLAVSVEGDLPRHREDIVAAALVVPAIDGI